VSGWTDERVDALKTLWAQGLSASQIADRLGGCSRNAVIGKVHRLQLPARRTRSHIKSPRARARSAARRPPAARRPVPSGPPKLPCDEYVPPPELVQVPPAERIQLWQLGEHTCRWPLGDPVTDKDFGFCGRPPVRGRPYCAPHKAMGYQEG
jgi:GcrA cell cycle regulator